MFTSIEKIAKYFESAKSSKLEFIDLLKEKKKYKSKFVTKIRPFEIPVVREAQVVKISDYKMESKTISIKFIEDPFKKMEKEFEKFKSNIEKDVAKNVISEEEAKNEKKDLEKEFKEFKEKFQNFQKRKGTSSLWWKEVKSIQKKSNNIFVLKFKDNNEIQYIF